MEGSSVCGNSFCFKVVFFEGGCFPCSSIGLFSYERILRDVGAYEVSMSTVRSVSGLAVDVLKLTPFCTVNHCPFLDVFELVHMQKSIRWDYYLCTISFRFRRSARTFSPDLRVPVKPISCRSSCVTSFIESA